MVVLMLSVLVAKSDELKMQHQQQLKKKQVNQLVQRNEKQRMTTLPTMLMLMKPVILSVHLLHQQLHHHDVLVQLLVQLQLKMMMKLIQSQHQ
jgi:hypothetical protein